MADVTFGTEAVTALIAKMNAADQVIANAILNKMTASLDAFQQAVMLETPVGVSGNLRGSIQTNVEGTPLNLTGRVVSNLGYAPSVEAGRAPGRMPPVSNLVLWVTRVWGKSGKDAESAAWALARHIARHGTKGAFMFGRGYNNALPAVQRLWDEFPGVVITELNK
jgi:hypothetical protein